MAIVQGLSLILLLFLGHGLLQVGGAAIYAGTMALTIVPAVGQVARFLLLRLKLQGVLKLATWFISSSGLLAGYWAHTAIWGPPTRPMEFWIVLAVATYLVAEIVYYLVTFDLIDFSKATKFAASYAPATAEAAGAIPKIRTRLALQNFVAFYLTQFFRLLVAIGLIFFSVGRLGVVSVVARPPTLMESERMAFSMIDIATQEAAVYTGTGWDIIRTLAAFLVFYWLVMFVSLASSTIEPSEFHTHTPTDGS